jgi:P27 family predicted phage terminase small subunit
MRPAWLTGEAKKKWIEVVPELERLGLLTIVDGAALAGFCQSWKDFVECTRFLKKEGRTFTTDNGYVVQRPEVAIAQRALQAVKAFGAEFGLTPSGRVRLNGAGGKKDGDLDYEDYRQRGSSG